uniref:DUF559 domain-containing protein n=1 Tax=Rhabditophanes sp. KR3021 TaxID=114890 RepID=A0AC35UFJ7_9BILA
MTKSSEIYEQLYTAVSCPDRGISNLGILTNFSNKKACFVCTIKKCLKHYVTNIANRTYCVSGCPNSVKLSVLHDVTKSFLDDYKVNRVKLVFDIIEKSYPRLVGDSGSDLLSFDFTIGKDLLLEINGGYHFKPSGCQNEK